jgi:two-component system response regulator HupR/HoxA
MLAISQNNKLTTDVISSHIVSALPEDIPKELAFVLDDNHSSLKSKIETLESHVIEESLIRNDWNKTKTADELGLSRLGLRNKLDRYNIKPNEHVVIPLESIAKTV